MWPVCAVCWLNRPSECMTGIERNRFRDYWFVYSQRSVSQTLHGNFGEPGDSHSTVEKKKKKKNPQTAADIPGLDPTATTHTLSGQHHGMDILCVCAADVAPKKFSSLGGSSPFSFRPLLKLLLLLHSSAWKKTSSIK